ncbi:adenylyl cyclase-associated protein, partial [Phenoliferia sp. Uapishka_3]
MSQAPISGASGNAIVEPRLVPLPQSVQPAAQLAPAASPAVQAYQSLLDGPLAAYLDLSNQLGGLTAQQATFVSQAFEAQQNYIVFTSACTKLASSSPVYAEKLGPTANALTSAVEIKEKNRGSKEINFLSTVAEGIPALGWVQVEPKPGPFVNEGKDSAQFWANRVVKDNKESNPKAVEWARSFINLLEELRKYVMQYHTTGVSWNPKGADPLTYTGGSSASAGGAPPPPPPPPPQAGPPPVSSSASPAAGMGSVFASLNKGESVTQGLKKVDKSEMTHKNPELRSSGVVAAAVIPTLGKAPTKPPKPHSFQKKPPKTQLEGKKWSIENHENNPNIIISETEINQIIDIFNVKSSIIQIKGKVNAVSLVNCSKISILLDSTVSSLAISSSPSFTVQILGKVPTILIDGTDGGQVYLSRESLDVEIITAKSSSINISLPVEGDEEGIFEEKAVPEQFKTVVREGKLVTTVMEHSA